VTRRVGDALASAPPSPSPSPSPDDVVGWDVAAGSVDGVTTSDGPRVSRGQALDGSVDGATIGTVGAGPG